MKLMRKIVSLTLIGVMAVSLLSGCSKSEGNETKTNASGTETEKTETVSDSKQESTESESTQNEVAKPESITYMVHAGLAEEDGSKEWCEEYEKQTGVKLNLQFVSNNEYSTILDLAFASGEVPDIFDLNGEQLAVYAKQGALADLTDLVKNSEFYDRVDPAIWESIALDGKIYGVPNEMPSGAVTYVRKDWLDRLGMEIPTTYDEFKTMLTRFKNEIPECSVPFTAAGLRASMYLPDFYLGANPSFIKVDGTWVDGMSQENMTGALQRMQDAYAAGLIDSEVVTNTTSNCRDQWYSGSVGAFTYWAGFWGQTLTERLQMNIPDAEVVAIPPVEGAVYEFALPSGLCINGGLSEEKVASMFKYWLEFCHDGADGQVLFQSGVEGVHWEQDGDHIKMLPSLANPEEMMQKAWGTPWLAISPLLVEDKDVLLQPAVEDSLNVINTYGTQGYVYPLSETRTKINSDLTLIRDEVIAKVVMGDLTVEEGLNKYKEEADMLGVSKVLEEMNQ